MTARQLVFHLVCFAVAGLVLGLALLAVFFFVPRIVAEHRAWWYGLAAWESLMAAVLIGAGVKNFTWGFITARPMWVMVGAGLLSGVMLPLGVWAWRVWRGERQYLQNWDKHLGGEPQLPSKLRAR